jgi:long-chain acyl-CoA synthetase
MADRPWTATYPPGITWDAELKAGFVGDMLSEAAREYGERPAVEFMDKQLTYRELDALSDRFAAGLQKLGVGPGVHVGLFLANSPHYTIAFFGVMKAGGVVVNYSPLDAGPTLLHKAEDSETQILVTLDLAALYPQMAEILSKTHIRALIVGQLDEMTPAPEMIRKSLEAMKMLAPVTYDDRHIRFSEVLDNDGSYVRHPQGDPFETLAALQYTGGTTGLPKGAMLTHGALSSAASVMAGTTQTTPPLLEFGTERTLGVLPPFHIYALVVNMLMSIRTGSLVVQHARFEVDAVIRDIARKKISTFCGVPTMYVALLAASQKNDLDLSSLKVCNSGGAPLPVEVREAFRQRTGATLAEGWGMTETTACGTFSSPRGITKAGSCGQPLPRVELEFRDIDDPNKTVPLGERGEICVRAPFVMKGYWKNPSATAEVMTSDGFLRTGDVGYMDDEGFVYIVDRTKDMLLCGGFNVYPRTIEEAIYMHPSIAEVAVIGIPDEYRGQSPKAYVKLKSDAQGLGLDELKAFLKDKIGKHEMIAALEIWPDLPKTPVGKLSKKELYEAEARATAASVT